MSARYTSRDVACPACGAEQGERCRGSVYLGRGSRTVDYHLDRRQAARALNDLAVVMDAIESREKPA